MENISEILDRLMATSVNASITVSLLADEYVALVKNPTGYDVIDSFHRGQLTGKIQGICAVMNDLSGVEVDWTAVLDRAFEAADSE